MSMMERSLLGGIKVILIDVLLLAVFLQNNGASSRTFESDKFSERLLLKPLPDGHIYAFFQFTTTWNVDITKWDTNFRLFPRSLGEIASHHHVQELHFRLTQGLWRHRQWGFPAVSTSPGGELWVWFQNHTQDAEKTWKELTNALSGQFCASLNFIESSNTAQPQLSFRPEGVIKKGSTPNSSQLFYATLPQESICTENLTPWKKLLPCETKAGISTLLNAIHVFNSNYFSLSVDLIPNCQDESCLEAGVKLQQSVSIVFNPFISGYALGKPDWDLADMFGAILKSSCPVASISEVYVDISTNDSYAFTLSPPPTKTVADEFAIHAIYDIKDYLSKEPTLNIAGTYQKKHVYWVVPPPPLHATRYVKGYGLGGGGINCRITNNEGKPIKIIYLEIIPWFLRMYYHTLRITHKGQLMKPEYQYYRPGKDRERPHHMELVFTLPPKSTVEVAFEFERAFLKWTEYPPDANHGFYVGPSVISAVISTKRNLTLFDWPINSRSKSSRKYFIRIHTETLLVSLPTPDFSMPYNVICLVCTVIALAFGPIHNVTTKKLHLVTKDSSGSYFDLFRLKRKEDKESSKKAQQAKEKCKQDE